MKSLKDILYRHRVLFFRLTITCLLFWFLFRSGANLRKTFDQMMQASPLWLLGAFTAKILTEYFTAFKWHYLMQRAGLSVKFIRVLYVYFTGFFYGLFIPGVIGGDIPRLFMLAPDSGGKAKALASIFMQRNTGFAGMFILVDILLFFYPIQLQIFTEPFVFLNDVKRWFFVLTLGYIFTNILILTPYVTTHLTHYMQCGGKFLAKIASLVTKGHNSLLLFRNSIFPSVILSIFAQLLTGLSFWCLLCSVGLSIGFWHSCIYMTVLTLVFLIPISFNGLGLREIMYAAMFAEFGCDKSTAVALGLLQFGLIVLFSLCCGLWHFSNLKLKTNS
ncbi:flippase-like domain-containing protein [Candidatus Sumerlaeota bacterium]|nr:flippase-like domain-containing protein [Candidatus Sumerlaeota bacterium]